MTHADAIVATALSQAGDQYVWGAEAGFNDPNPDAFDCSELVEWACARNGVTMADGSVNQRAFCSHAGTMISVARGIVTRGALLFRIGVNGNHVVISLGDGHTIEAKGRAWGVNVFNSIGRTWTDAALIPAVDYGSAPPAPKPGLSKRRPKLIIAQAPGHDPIYAWNGSTASHLNQESIDLLVTYGVAVRNGNAPVQVSYDTLNRAHVVGARNDKTMPGDGK